MIETFEGRIGGGKTINAVRRFLGIWRKGGIVGSNVSIKWPEVKQYALEVWGLELDDRQFIFLSNDMIPQFYRHVPPGTREFPSMVCIDEAHLFFNSRDWNQTDRKMLAWLTQSRKQHTDVIFISQSMLNMDKQFARLNQYIWRFRDMSKFVIPGLGIPFPLPMILCSRFDYDGHTLLDRQWWNKNPRFFRLYDTDALYTPFERTEEFEVKVVKRQVGAKGKLSIIAVCLAILVAACIAPTP